MHLEYPEITFEGPSVTDGALLNSLPDDLRWILSKKNGFIVFCGGLHIRGICEEPIWHSLKLFWKGKYAFSKMYSSIQSDDIPFGQDCMGDQYLLRANEVIKLHGESGDIKSMKMNLLTFFEEVLENPFLFLELSPLKQF